MLKIKDKNISNRCEEVQLDVARGYLRLSDIEGNDMGGFSLGRSAEASIHAQKAVEITRRVVSRNGARIQARAVLVDALDFSTTAFLLCGEVENGVPLAEEGVRQAEQLLAAAPQWVEAQLRLATATKQLANAYQRGGKKNQAIALFRRSIEMRKWPLDEAPHDSQRLQSYSEANNCLAAALSKVRKIREIDPANVSANQELVYAMVDLALTRKAAGQEQKALRFMKTPPKGMSSSVGVSLKEAEKIGEKCGRSLARGKG